MPLIRITHWWDGKQLYEVEATDLKEALHKAVAEKVDLSGSDLTPIRDDLWAVLSAAPAEVPGLLAALKEAASTVHLPPAPDEGNDIEILCGLDRVDRGGEEVRRDVFVYISGPMTAKHGYTIEENVAAGLRVYLDCLKRGIPAFSPHLGGAFPSAWSEVGWETWLAFDLAVIDRCTHVLMMPRWETSAGAVKERAYAESKGVPIIVSLDEIECREQAEKGGATCR